MGLRVFVSNSFLTNALTGIMKIKQILILAVALCGLFTAVDSALAQGTAFTYQGQIFDNGSLANGAYSLTFALFTTNAGGVAMAGPVTNEGVAVSNGLFTVQIDFGSGVFTGETNWLQIGVATNGSNTFTALTPRQLLTATPYAIYAESGGNATALASGAALGAGFGNLIASNGATDSFIGGGMQNQILLNSLYSAIDGGQNNIIEPNAGWSVVAGGEGNVTFSGWSVISGGNGNNVGSGTLGSAIGGGFSNTNNANYGTLAGGQSNIVSGVGATVAGGVQNTASGLNATVGGGGQNIASGNYSTVAGGGGYGNNASGESSSIGGGLENTASGNYSTIGGGAYGMAIGVGSFIGGGGYDGVSPFIIFNSANGNASVIGGGIGNVTSAIYATVGGGNGNNAGGGGQGGGGGGGAATVGGGNGNTADGANATVGGGFQNIAGSDFSTVGGGQDNIITNGGENAFIGGGTDNTNTGFAATVAGGQANFASDAYATISGGLNNTNSGFAATVAGGSGNSASGGYATVCGGYDNTASGGDSFAAGVFAQAINNNTFVWSDGSAITTSTSANQFMARASGGYIFYSSSATPNNIVTIGGTTFNRGDNVTLTLFVAGSSVIFSYTLGNGESATTIANGLNQDINNNNSSDPNPYYPGIQSTVSGSIITITGLNPQDDVTDNITGTGNETVTLSGGMSGSGAEILPGDTTWRAISDRNAKKDIEPEDCRTVLNKLAQVPISHWHYKWEAETNTPHIGPMAQDFMHAFYPGRDDKGITTLEFDGVELAAIQGLNQKLNEKDAEIQDLKQSVADLRKLVQSLAEKK
jgi:hypothetical protein